MVFVYIRIYYAAKARARRGIRKPPRRTPQDAVTSFSNTPGASKSGGTKGATGVALAAGNGNSSPRDTERKIATIESHPRPIPIPMVTCDVASDISTSDGGDVTADASDLNKDTLKVRNRVGRLLQSTYVLFTYILTLKLISVQSLQRSQGE